MPFFMPFRKMKITIRVLLGCVFMLSAILKLIDMDSFELFIFKSFEFNWILTGVLCRLLVSIELGLGIFYIVGAQLAMTNLISGLLILLMSFWLVYQLFLGNTENCHCFGEIISFSPHQALIKNIILLLFIGFLHKLKDPSIVLLPPKFRVGTIVFLIIVVLLLPAIISPPDFLFPDRYTVEGVTKKINFDEIEQTPWHMSDNAVDLRQGKKIVMFLSMNCEMCQKASKKAAVMNNRQGDTLPIYFIFFGKEEGMNGFWEKTTSHKFPYKIISADLFFSTTKLLPTIFFLKDGKIEKVLGYRNFDDGVVKEFLNEHSEN